LSPICSIALASSVTGASLAAAPAQAARRENLRRLGEPELRAILGAVDSLYPGFVFCNGFHGFRHWQRQDPSTWSASVP